MMAQTLDASPVAEEPPTELEMPAKAGARGASLWKDAIDMILLVVARRKSPKEYLRCLALHDVVADVRGE